MNKVQEQIDELRKNVLFNWPHLANYSDQMFKAADTLESMQARIEQLIYENETMLEVLREQGIAIDFCDIEKTRVAEEAAL